MLAARETKRPSLLDRFSGTARACWITLIQDETRLPHAISTHTEPLLVHMQNLVLVQCIRTKPIVHFVIGTLA